MFFQGALSHRRRQQGQENATKNTPKTTPKKCRETKFFYSFSCFSTVPPKELQKAPKNVPGEAKMGSRSGPGGSKSGPGAPQGPPGAPQERPKSAPKRSKKDQKRSPPRFWASEGLREAPGSDFGVILAPPGRIFEPCFEDFRRNFDRMLAAIFCSAFALLAPRFASFFLKLLAFRLACA